MAGRRSSGSSKLWPYLFSISACFNFLLFWWQGAISKSGPNASSRSVSETFSLQECRAEVDRLKKQSSLLDIWESVQESARQAAKDGGVPAEPQLEKCRRDGTSLATVAAEQIRKCKSDLETERSDSTKSSCARELELVKHEAKRAQSDLRQCQSDMSQPKKGGFSGMSCDARIRNEQRHASGLKESLHISEQSFLNLQKTKNACVDPRLELDPRWFGTEQLIRARSSPAALPAPAPQVPTDKFDITVNAFKRDMELEYSLNVYLKCMREGKAPIAKIHVVWNDAKREIPEKLRDMGSEEELIFFIPPTEEDRISNRFWPLDFFSDAVFHVDDDCPHMCETLSDMFQLWRTDPDGMVGTSPRLMDLESGERDIWYAPLIMGMYNIVFLTKGAFVHQKFLKEYWKDEWKPMREVADKYNCAEDILFSMMHLTVVGTDHVYSVGGSVNHGRRMLLEGHSFYLEVQKVESYSGLNVRTWGVRGKATVEIAALLRKTFPKRVKEGIYKRFQRKFWRSKIAPDLTCRMAPVPCFNRAWSSCYQDCEVPVRGNSVCFTGDSACYAGMGLSLRKDIGENMQMICTEGGCSS